MNVGDLLLDKSTHWYMRVVAVDPDYAHLMPIGIPNQWTIRKSARYVKAMLDSESWTNLIGHQEPLTTVEGVIKLPHSTPGARSRGDRLFNRLSSALIDVKNLLTPKGRAQNYRQLRDTDKKLSKQTFYSALRRWLEGGLTISTLDARWRHVPGTNLTESIYELDFSSAKRTVQDASRALQQLGAPDSSRKTETKSGHTRQRAAPYEPTRYRANNRETVRVFAEYFKRKKDPSCGSLNSLWEVMIDEVFSTPQPYGPPLRWPMWSIPSKSQFSRYWRKLHNIEARQKLLRGEHRFELSSRALLGQQVSEAFVAGRLAQLDATVWNVPLIGDEPGAPIIGPPIVFRIRCIDTGQLLGISISLESASFNNAAMAIAHCLENKTDYCSSLDVYQAGLPWEIIGLPAQIDADQGETYNNKPAAFIRLSGTSITSMKGGRGDMKGGVESDFNTIQVQLSPLTPGAIIKSFEAEHGIKWHMRAAMTVRAFTRSLILQELKKMHTTRANVRLPTRMQDGETNTSPYSMFQWGLRRGGGSLRIFDTKLVRLSLLPRGAASIDEFGVLFKDVHFECTALTARHASVSSRVHGRKKIRVAYDPLLAGCIWVIVGDPVAPTEYYPCALSQKFPYQRGYEKMSWREIQMRREASIDVDIKHSADVAKAIAIATEQQRQIANESKQWTKEQRRQHPTTESQLLRNMPSARLAEKNKEAPKAAISAPLQEVENSKNQEQSSTDSNVVSIAFGQPRGSQLERKSSQEWQKTENQNASENRDAMQADEYSELLDYFSADVPTKS